MTATTHEFNLSTQADSTVCQLVEEQHSFLSEPHTLCELVCFYIKTCSLTRSPFLLCHSSFLSVSICSSHLPLLSLSVFSSAFCLSLSLSSSLFFPLRSAHFSRTPFPPGSQATKYSDWCRQLGLITNGKQSRAAAVGGCTVASLQQTMNHMQAAEKPQGTTHRIQGCKEQ